MGWTKTIFKFSDRICYSFWAYSDERKHFWSLRIRFAIDIKRFRMNENTFEAFAYYIRFRMDEKKILKASDRICYWFLAFSDGRKHFWSIRILFDIDFKRFRMNKNTFEAFAFDLPSTLGVFGWTKTLWKHSHSICSLF